jgi:elongation factor P--(R)-beta-lysine ligase
VTRGGSQWRSGATLEALRRRAGILAELRAFFDERGVLEVDTPLLASATATDPQLESIPACPFGETPPWYLQTSPEFAMKRLLAMGSGAIYQLGKSYRRREAGPRHNPEFTMLEWYRPGFDTTALMHEVAELVARVIGARPLRRSSYRELFVRHALPDPFLADDTALQSSARELSGGDVAAWARDNVLDLLFSARVEPHLGRDCFEFVTGFPPARAALARIAVDADGTSIADRFELFVDGMELANGYNELRDAAELRRRMQQDNKMRIDNNQPSMPIDERLLAALPSMPDCAGVALGVDRLVMLALGVECIDEAIAFSAERA